MSDYEDELYGNQETRSAWRAQERAVQRAEKAERERDEARAERDAVLRLKGQLVEALEAVQRVDRLDATPSERQEARNLWTAALKAAKETP